MGRGKTEKTVCKQCKKEFDCLLIKKRQGKGLFCSRECYSRWRTEHKEDKKIQAKRHQLRYKYGLSEAEFNIKCEQQENRCKICGTLVNTLYVDHCHETGEIRGLLCSKCNTGLGLFNDSITNLHNAINYLKDSFGGSNPPRPTTFPLTIGAQCVYRTMDVHDTRH